MGGKIEEEGREEGGREGEKEWEEEGKEWRGEISKEELT